jgi:acyl-CoA reductase-like NAD-dependent aldehyde dehydrogenase
MTTSSINRGRLLERAQSLSNANLLNGALHRYPDDQCFPVADPATRQPLGRAPKSGPTDVDHAVLGAVRAQVEWARLRPLDRAQVLNQAIDKVETHADELSGLVSLETGRPLRTETRPEVHNALRILRYFAGLALEMKGETIPFAEHVLSFTLREPLGVVAAIIPWNVPVMLMSLKVGPALICGNTIVVKSAEQSPLSTLFLGSLLAEVLPPGVLQVISGHGPDTGQPLVRHPDIAKIAFTGSVEAGKSVYGVAAERIVPATLELGGKSPLIVFPDTPAERAADFAITGMRFSRQGQSCTSTTRIYVPQSMMDPFVNALVARLSSMVIGDPLAESTDIGTLISREQLERVQRYVDEARNLPGVKVIQVGELPTQAPHDRGLFYQPTIVLNPPPDSCLVQEENCGPVVAVLPWQDYEELIAQANGTKYGLSACIVTQNLPHALETARRLKAGYVQVNSGLVIQPGVSFGGYKSSGIGRESSLESMLEAYTQVKTILIDHST